MHFCMFYFQGRWPDLRPLLTVVKLLRSIAVYQPGGWAAGSQCDDDGTCMISGGPSPSVPSPEIRRGSILGGLNIMNFFYHNNFGKRHKFQGIVLRRRSDTDDDHCRPVDSLGRNQ